MARYNFTTNLDSSGYKIYVYTNYSRQAAKIYLTYTSSTTIQIVPQIITDSTGVVSFWVDTNDYAISQRFDIDIYDALDKHYSTIEDIGIFKVDYYNLANIRIFNYTWNYDISILDGECLDFVIPSDKQFNLPDGFTVNVADGGNLIIFSL